MKNLIRVSFLAVFAALSVLAQGPTPIQQSSQRLDAATYAATNVASATTTTIVVPANMYFYVTGVDIQNCAGASAVTPAAVTTITTTNLAGSPAYTVGSGAGAGLCTNQTIPFISPMKSAAPGTNVTFVMPTFATNQTIRLNVYGYFGN